MYLRRNRKKVNGEVYEYWTLVESIRTASGPRQRIVSTLGKLPGLDEQEALGWEQLADELSGRPTQPSLFESDAPPDWATVDVSRLRVERLRSFGDVYLALSLWRRLQLDEFFNQAMDDGREDIAWGTIACILTLARFCAPSYELQIADFWYPRSALDDLLGVPVDKVNDDRLYRGLDKLLPHKDALFSHFHQMYHDLFGLEYDLLLYDITSTYFEGQAKGNPQAKRGYSRDSRPDCVQVCIGLVVTPEGLPLSYEVFDGNRADVSTIEEIIEHMREKYGHLRRIWVWDRGMVSEDNLELLRDLGASYIVGTPKSMLQYFEQELLDQDWEQLASAVEVKLCSHPEGGDETFVLCRSAGRKEKETAIRKRHIEGLEKGIEQLIKRMAAPKRALRDKVKAERRIGALLQKYSRASKLYSLEVEQQADDAHSSGVRLRLKVTRHEARKEWVDLAEGCYLLRSNLKDRSAKELWETYVGLTEIEDCFRTSKHDLGLRPVFHRTQERTQAHILVCFLSLVLWRTLQQWMKTNGLGTAPRKLLEEMAEVKSLDVVLPTSADTDIRLRTVSRPETHLAILLQRLKLRLPGKTKRIENVVEKIS